MPKFAPTKQAVDEVILALKSKKKQEDAWKLLAICQSICGMNPQVWYPGIIGFGEFHYKTDSGLEGVSPLLSFAPRQARITLHIDRDLPKREDYLKRLGKHKRGASCVYINKLDDIDLSLLEAMLKDLFAFTKDKNNLE